MKETIGEMAGRVWKILGKKGRVEISKLPQILKEKGDIVYQALGWLAREEKILFHKKEGRTYTSLNPEEREKFNRSI
jgi:Winged helix-turn-helix domain (DUF2582)